MRLTLVTSGLPVRETGARRTWEALAWLARRHDVALVPLTLGGEPPEPADLPAGVSVHDPVPIRPTTRLEEYLANGPDRAGREELGAALRPYAATCDWLWLGWPRLARADLGHPRCAITWDWDCLSLWNATAVRGLSRSAPARAARHAVSAAGWAWFEASALRSVDAVSVPSSRERRWLGRIAQPPVHVVRNFTQVPPEPAAGGDGGTALFLGSDFPPNVAGARWLLDHVWPQVASRHAGARLQLVGRGLGAVFRERLPAGVEVHADVPAVEPYYRGADVFVAPVAYGGGTQNKLLEAAAHGVPVVTTPYGARTLEDATGFLVRRDARAWADGVVELLGDATLRRGLGRQGRETIAAHHGREAWEGDLARLEGAVERLRHARAATRA